MKTQIYYIITFLAVIINNCYSLDTLKHYESSSSKYMLRDDNISEYTERFLIDFDGEINGLRIKVNGSKGNTGTIRLYGNELSDVIPSNQISIIEDINFVKQGNGSEWININFDSPIYYKNKQVFISVMFNDPSSNIFTDNAFIEPSCISNNCFSLNHQLVKDNVGKWKQLESSFLIDLFTTKYTKKENINFKALSFKEIEDIIQPINSISIYDFNKDGNQDILTNQYLLLNMGIDNFIKSNIIDSNSNCIVNIFINDPIVPRIISFMRNSKYHYINNIKLNGSDLVSEIDSFEIGYDIVDIQSYSLKDINDDDYLDIILAINNDSTSEVMALTHNANNAYQKSFSIETDNISSISFNPIVKYKSQLIVNYISKEMEIYEMDNTGFSIKNTAEQTEYMKTDYYITDINNNSIKDIVTVNQKNPSINIIELLDNEIPATLIKKINSDDNELFSPIVEDFDNNGFKDILLTTRCECRKGSIFYQNARGEFEENSLLSGFNEFSIGPAIVKIDFNNDGKIDFLSLSDKKLIGFLNSSSNNNNYIQFEDKKNKVNEVVAITKNNKYTSIAAPNGRSLNIQEPNLFHIGIPEGESVDSIIVKNDLGEEIYSDIELNKKYDIDELKIKPLPMELSNDFYSTPNPFKSNVSIIINTPDSKSLKTIRIYNQSGEIVFIKEITTQKKIVWNGKNSQGTPVASGAYIATIESEGKVLKNKLLKID